MRRGSSLTAGCPSGATRLFARSFETSFMNFLFGLLLRKYSEVLRAGMLTGGVGSLLAVTPLS
jgi:hypothetical protein